MASLNVGDAIPETWLNLHNGERVRLNDLVRDQVVVLFFYPKDGTPLCTQEACAFRDAYEDFTQAGALVIGVSNDSEEHHRRFIEQQRLPYRLAADTGGALRRAWGVPKTWGFLPGRVTYVIDRSGIIRQRFDSQWFAGAHVKEALDQVRALTPAGEAG